MSREKELNFFVHENNWNKGIEWYKSNFTGEAEIHGESSPRYTSYPFFGGIPERMYSIVPGAKLIYILRDPIERIISHYIQTYANGRENRTITEALTNLDNNIYVCYSKYYMQLSQYLKYFPKANILIITMEYLSSHRQQTLQQVFRFLDVDDSFYSHKFSKIKHKSIYNRRKNRFGVLLSRTPIMNIVKRLPFAIRGPTKVLLYYPFSRKTERPMLDDNLRAALIDYLKDDINRLREYTGRDFDDWCV